MTSGADHVPAASQVDTRARVAPVVERTTVEEADHQLRRGLMALRLEAPASVVDDVTKRVEAAVAAKLAAMDDELDAAWGIIANASGGDWTRESAEWQDAAALRACSVTCGSAWSGRTSRSPREAFVDGARSSRGRCASENDIEVARRAATYVYPLPKVRRPLRVTLSDGTTWSMRPADDHWSPDTRAAQPFAGWLSPTSGGYVGSGMDALRESLRTVEDVALIARVIAGETEEVDAE